MNIHEWVLPSWEDNKLKISSLSIDVDWEDQFNKAISNPTFEYDLRNLDCRPDDFGEPKPITENPVIPVVVKRLNYPLMLTISGQNIIHYCRRNGIKPKLVIVEEPIRKGTPIFTRDHTYLYSLRYLEQACKNTPKETLEKSLDEATSKTFTPREMGLFKNEHNETLFDSSRIPISPNNIGLVLDILSKTTIYVVECNGVYHTMDGRHRINTAIMLDMDLDIKVIDGESIGFDVNYYMDDTID